MKKQNGIGYAWVILLVVCLANFTPSFAQYQMSPIAGELMERFSLNKSQFASIFSAPMIPSIFLSLASGLLVDKFGAKKVIAIGLIIASIGISGRLFATSYETLLIPMILAGFSATFLNANGAKILGSWFPAEKVSMVMGISLASSTIGMTVGLSTTALFPGIKTAFMAASMLSVIMLIVWLFFMKESKGVKEQNETIPMKECISRVVKNKFIWIIALCLMFTMGCNVTMSTFLPAVLNAKGVDVSLAGAMSALVTVGNLCGSIFAPMIAVKFKNNRVFIFSLGLCAAVFTILAGRIPVGLGLTLCLFIVGVSIGGLIPSLLSLPIMLPEIGPKYAGTAGGVIGTIELLGAVVIPTYIIAPLAKSNEWLFLLAGLCSAFVCICSIFLPKYERN